MSIPFNSYIPLKNRREKFCILIKISLKFAPKGPIYNNSALV